MKREKRLKKNINTIIYNIDLPKYFYRYSFILPIIIVFFVITGFILLLDPFYVYIILTVPLSNLLGIILGIIQLHIYSNKREKRIIIEKTIKFNISGIIIFLLVISILFFKIIPSF